MEKPGRRGKIPQTDWPLIMGRYEAGETLASIARTYDCSPPAISYIVSRSRDRQPAAEAAAPVTEPQLVKVHTAEPAMAEPAMAEPAMAEAVAAPPPPPAPVFVERERNAGLAATLARGIAPRSNGVSHPAPQASAPQPPTPPTPQANGGDRRTLHLSLGGNGANGGPANGHGGSDSNSNGNGTGFRQPAASAPPAPPPQQDRFEPRPVQPRYGFPPNGGDRSHGGFNGGPNGGPNGGMDAEPGRRNKDPGTFIDQELRTRVDGDIAAFLTAFDAALAGDTLESRAGLREATDRLLRAGARTRIELERLEARVPLATPRDGDSRSEPNWRHR